VTEHTAENDVPLVRPNGKPYRARKGIEVAEFGDHSTGCTGIVVLRTHDIERAKTCAASTLAAYELEADVARRDWWRLVPWDSSGEYERSYITDPVRGIPCVVFEPC
jgi:hypothetical protein